MPDMLNWFGWCTWDAFYTNVTASDVKQGLQRYGVLMSLSHSKPHMLSFFSLFARLLTKPAMFFCSLEAGGIPPKFVIIDDGWQSVGMDETSVEFNADNAAK